MQMSDVGKALLKRSEGFRATLYDDNGRGAIGYGHRVLPGESFPEPIDEAEGDELLHLDLIVAQGYVNARVPAACRQGQFDALCDFTYNVEHQPMALEQLLAHGWDQVPEQLPRWCHELVDGVWVVSPGLKARRLAEVALWKNG